MPTFANHLTVSPRDILRPAPRLLRGLLVGAALGLLTACTPGEPVSLEPPSVEQLSAWQNQAQGAAAQVVGTVTKVGTVVSVTTQSVSKAADVASFGAKTAIAGVEHLGNVVLKLAENAKAPANAPAGPSESAPQ